VLVVALAVVGFIAFHVSRATGGTTRDKVVAELDATDPNWRLHDLTAARNANLPPPEQNAAALAQRAHDKLPQSYRDWQKQPNSGAWRDDLKGSRLPQPEDVTQLRELLAEAKEAIDAARAVRHVPGGSLPLVFREPNPIFTALDDRQNLREVARLLSLVALVRAFDGDADGALDSTLAILAVARGFGDDPALVSQLIRTRCVALAIGSIEQTLAWCDTATDAKLAELQAALVAEAEVPRLVCGLRGDRAANFRLMENIDEGRLPPFSDPLNLVGMSSGRGPDLAAEVVMLATVRDQQATFLKLMERCIAAAKLPPGPDRTAEFATIEAECRGLPRHTNFLVRVLFPAPDKLNESENRIVGLLRTAVVALACERHRLKTGAFPEALADLPKELLAEVPTDPYTGKPILFKPTADGLVVYCTGADQTDDGGNLKPASEAGFDIGVRLFHPKHRRQSPLPPPDPQP
jgi:hypothetical protein